MKQASRVIAVFCIPGLALFCGLTSTGQEMVIRVADVLTQGDYSYYTNAAGQATITRLTKAYSGAQLSITNTLGGCPVTGIDAAVFRDYRSLTSVTIPASVTNMNRQRQHGHL